MDSFNLDKHHEIVRLHPKAYEISFRHRQEIARKFRDVLGIWGIHHISIDIISPGEELIYFSTTPSMGYNLIHNQLWQHDGSISPTYYKERPYYYWHQTYDKNFYQQIKQVKEADYGFAFGFTLVRLVEGFYILYSFATRNKDQETKDFFERNTAHLLKMGDYCYKLIREIYKCYLKNEPPIIRAPFRPRIIEKSTNYERPYLKLIVNNRSPKG